MKTLIRILWIIFIIVLILGLVLIFIGINTPGKFDKLINKTIYDFIGPFVGFLTVLLVIISILKQNIENSKSKIENHFFKMLDYHSENVRTLTVKHIKNDYDEKVLGRRAFVIFRLQLIKLLEIVEKINGDLDLSLEKSEIIDIAYIAFYYGIDDVWKDFLIKKLKRYNKSDEIVTKLIKYKNEIAKNEKTNIGRTNQTNLSVYFRNMYNAIKFIDENKILDQKEKAKYIKIFRAQLSNPELYIIFLNVVSRFGKKWKDNNYIEKYEYLKNIPFDYCGKYPPKEFYNMEYEEEEIE